MDKRYFREKLVEWYRTSGRTLPWRSTSDPYLIWLSEVILQQTRVAQGLPYYEKFVAHFPTVTALAAAEEQIVLRLWQGLGYYSRARNLLRCAQVVAEKYDGKFPVTSEALRTLPGIGPYTASAIASVAGNEKTAVVDGNVFRVLSRIFGIDVLIDSTQGKKYFQTFADSIICSEEPGVFNQAIMDFGATICTPAPRCAECIFQSKCFAFTHSMIPFFPVSAPRKKVSKRHFYYLVVQQGAQLLMKRRTGNDIWKGLYDFWLVEEKAHVKPATVYKRFFSAPLKEVKSYKHLLTHQIIHAHFILVSLKPGESLQLSEGLKFFLPAEIDQLPKPILIKKFIDECTLDTR